MISCQNWCDIIEIFFICRRRKIKLASDLRKKKLEDSLLFAQFNRDIEEVSIIIL